MGGWSKIVVGGALVAAAGAVQASPVMPGFVIEQVVRADNTDKVHVGQTGSLYLGQRGPGGGIVELHPLMLDNAQRSGLSPLGNSPIPDPNAIIVDIFGGVSGEAGNVLVGGSDGIYSIAADGSVTHLYQISSSVRNPVDFAFDASNRVVFTDWNQGRIRAINSDGSISTIAQTVGRSMNIAFNTDGSFVATDDQGNLNFFSATGARTQVLAGNWTSVFFGNGSSAWGTGLYAVDTATGNLVSFDGLNQTVVGTGFLGAFGDATWSPDGSIYITGDGSTRVFRIGEPIPAPGALAMLGLGGLAAARRRR